MDRPTFYTSLSVERQDIRLLQLYPGNPDDAVSCDLTVVSLQESPQYEALSYVWGDQEDTIPIKVCNEAFSARRNLEELLRHLRQPQDMRVLWVDAISINQSDVNERSNQVKLMGEIYRKASIVHAYLGDFNPAFAPFVEKIAGDPTLHWEPELKKLGEETDSSSPLFAFVFGVFRHPWWHRVWTLQEAVLAQNLDFVCGSRAFDLSTMTAFADSFCHHYQNEKCCDYTDIKYLPMNIWARIKYLRTVQRLRDRIMEVPISSLLDVTVSERHRRATDARDHVFGMLGLVQGFNDLVDYSASVSEVFQRAVVQEIRKHGSLDILSQVIVPDGPAKQDHLVENIPSWAPNWTRAYYPYYLNDVQYRQNLLHLYNSSRGEPARIISHENGRLALTGIICDTIEQVGQTLGPSSYPSWLQYIPIEDMEVVFSDDMSDRPYPHIAGGSQSYHQALFRMARADVIPLVYEEAGTDIKITEWGRSDPTKETRVGFFAERQLTTNTTSNRRIFRTARGYMGLAPKTAHVGDKVCIMLGAKVPYIIRKHKAKEETPESEVAVESDVFILVGDAYVHGLMDGEALDQVDSGQFKLETVVLGGYGL